MPNSRGGSSTSVSSCSPSFSRHDRSSFRLAGRIRAIQLNYTEAHTNLQQAIRRAPEAKVAPGFLQTAHKLSIVVELLMGEIPERRTFREPVLKKALVPYLEIVQGESRFCLSENAMWR